MLFKEKHTKDNNSSNCDWKEKNKKYLNQVQRFLDAADSIEREEIRKNVITQMLKCDQILTQLAQNEIKKYKLKDE